MLTVLENLQVTEYDLECVLKFNTDPKIKALCNKAIDTVHELALAIAQEDMSEIIAD